MTSKPKSSVSRRGSEKQGSSQKYIAHSVTQTTEKPKNKVELRHNKNHKYHTIKKSIQHTVPTITLKF